MATSNSTCPAAAPAAGLDFDLEFTELSTRLDELNGMLATFAECVRLEEMQGDWGCQALHGAARLARAAGERVQRVHESLMPALIVRNGDERAT
jgi:hypothetical protein